ncbi:hypothetical protein Ae201684P_021886 [Aphanomyces euteiches]|uniref:Uncharacterized protein n=1 Tax=Aphanomyces euteiches TaxID=100861 RepID=A0A6G0WST5_9STRA|nr:hypothetical protein Ae201684_011971 [Aphanomyces euteiches]KAH9056149.1 hypothetical protein Ae201684P_021886 [Aphanomyces euteiches]
MSYKRRTSDSGVQQKIQQLQVDKFFVTKWNLGIKMHPGCTRQAKERSLRSLNERRVFLCAPFGNRSTSTMIGPWLSPPFQVAEALEAARSSPEPCSSSSADHCASKF